eukprot:gene6901-biopygen136
MNSCHEEGGGRLGFMDKGFDSGREHTPRDMSSSENAHCFNEIDGTSIPEPDIVELNVGVAVMASVTVSVRVRESVRVSVGVRGGSIECVRDHDGLKTMMDSSRSSWSNETQYGWQDFIETMICRIYVCVVSELRHRSQRARFRSPETGSSVGGSGGGDGGVCQNAFLNNHRKAYIFFFVSSGMTYHPTQSLMMEATVVPVSERVELNVGVMVAGMVTVRVRLKVTVGAIVIVSERVVEPVDDCV